MDEINNINYSDMFEIELKEAIYTNSASCPVSYLWRSFDKNKDHFTGRWKLDDSGNIFVEMATSEEKGFLKKTKTYEYIWRPGNSIRISLVFGNVTLK